MKFSSIVSFLAAGLLLCGCVPSVNPLYTEKDLVFEDALVGSWKSEDGKESWVFEKSGEKAYELKHTDENGQKATFDAHLVKLKDHLFLDLYVTDFSDETKINNLGYIAMAPCHLIFKVYQIEPEPQFALLNADWIKKLLENKPDALKHRKTENSLLLTADTEALQEFIIEHADDEEAFKKDDALLLKPSTASAETKQE